jgi:hypothetical protein
LTMVRYGVVMAVRACSIEMPGFNRANTYAQ